MGKLGWLDISFPKPFVFLFYVVLLFTVICEVGDLRGIRLSVRLLSFAAFCVFVVGLFYVMYTVWTPSSMEMVGGDVAHGCQGRYFIPPMLFLLIIFASPLTRKLRLSDKMHALCEAVLPFFATIGLSLSCVLLMLKYFI